ncbi:MAG: hypothetical protein R3E42_19815 [Burkholderiaceae bacterium]
MRWSACRWPPEGKSPYDPLASEMGFYYSQASGRGINLGGAHV